VDAKAMKPRILVLTKLFWPEGGGAELATYLIIKDILSKHFDVAIVSGTRSPEPDILEHARYIHWGALEARYKPIEWIKTFMGIGWVRNLVEEADIVYIPSHTLIPLTIAVKTINPRTKIALHLHNYQLLTYTSVVLANREPDVATDIIVELGEHKSLLRALLAGFGHYINYINRFAAMLADKIICVSHRQCEIILRYIPEVRGKAEVIYNPPPSLPSLNKRINDKPIVIYIGGGSYIKGFEMFLETIFKALIKGLDIKVYITYGRGMSPKEEVLLKRILRNLGNNLVLLGRLSYDEYLKLHEVAWALLFPSIWEEPLPYAIIESMLLGTIPIASGAGGVPEIIRGSPAEEYLFTPGDINEFIDRIEKLLSQSKKDIIDIGIKLREHILRLLNEERIENKLVSLFKFLAG
jgi:glycosyltransferase involved in cell wall biosynthesis